MSSTKKLKAHKRGIWLIGATSPFINGSKLPSNRQVISRFLHLHQVHEETVKDSAKTTTKELLSFWEKARIPTRQDFHITNKIKDFYTQYQKLRKNISRQSSSQQTKVKEFTECLDDLFDVAHSDALHMIKIDEDRKFLVAQREKGRSGTIGSVDRKLYQKEKRQDVRLKKEMVRREKETQRLLEEQQNVNVDQSPESEDEKDKLSEPEEAKPSTSWSKASSEPSTIRPQKIITSGLASALDRSQISDRKATHVIAATIRALGDNPEQYALNKEIIRQARRSNRECITTEIKDSFDPQVPLTVHWDGKLLPALTSKTKVERLAILVSGKGTMKLLGVPMLSNGTGEAQAAAVFDALIEWGISDRIQAMAFDTTSSNTGNNIGACVLLERKLQRDLLHLACRHHIHELIVEKVFGTLLETSSGPNIKLFERFSQVWDSIDKVPQSALQDTAAAGQLTDVSEIITFINQQLLQIQPRGDYKELLELALLFLGADDTGNITIKSPGAYHRARWMAKLIYCLKIYVLRDQFHLRPRELSGLREFNLFVVKLYLKSWYTCQVARYAPSNDLQLYKDIISYKACNSKVSSVAAKGLSNHMWYVSERLVGLALFDERFSSNEKAAMVTALKKPGQAVPEKRIKLSENHIHGKGVCNFITNNSLHLLSSLGINASFLQKSPQTWSGDESYIMGKAIVDDLKVTNDAAERGVALIQSYNNILTIHEDQKQYLLQVVEEHRKMYPDANKSTILKL